MTADIEVRVLRDGDGDPRRDDIDEWARIIRMAFGGRSGADDTKELVMVPDRRIAAFAGERIVGTAGDFPFDLTVPGGGTVPVGGVSAVSVAATHRRRGILRQMMAFQLDEIAARGDAMAVLNASESGIYRRFGYGVATSQQSFAIDTARARFREPVGHDLEVQVFHADLVDDARAVVAPIYVTWQRTHPGSLSHCDNWWRAVITPTESWIGGGNLFVVACPPGALHDGGFAVYTVDVDHPFGFVVQLRYLVSTDDVVEARLWRYLLELDLVSEVRAEMVPLDSPLRWWLTDPRQVRTVEVRDWLHVRILDVVSVLQARRYSTDGEVVLGVHDPFRPDGAATNGRFLVKASAGGAVVTPTDQAADLDLDIAALGSLSLGGTPARELVRVGWATPRTPDAVERADRLFAWPVVPFCITHF